MFPGPSNMLPACDLSSSPTLDSNISFKKKEAEWKRLVSSTHNTWCFCGSYLNHFKPLTASLEKETCGEEDAGAGITPEGSDGAGDGEGSEEGLYFAEDTIEQ